MRPPPTTPHSLHLTALAILIANLLSPPAHAQHPNTVWNAAELATHQANRNVSGWSDLYAGRINSTDAAGTNLQAYAQIYAAPTISCTTDSSCDAIATATCTFGTGHCYHCVSNKCQGWG